MFILDARRRSITQDAHAQRQKKPPVRGRRLFHKVALGIVFLNILRRCAARSRLVSKDAESTKSHNSSPDCRIVLAER